MSLPAWISRCATRATLVVLGFACTYSARGQALEGPGYVALDRPTEVAMARSAAPATVSDEATIWLLRNDTYEIGVEGSNGNHCLVMRSYPKSVEPLCYDAEGSRTILPIEIRRFELRLAGRTWDEIDAIIAEDIAQGRRPVPNRPAMSYMLSSAQILYAPDGRNVGNWKPHLMLYMPNMTEADFGMFAGATPDLSVVKPGEPLANLIIVVPEFVDPLVQ